jgi:hypothetical protein
MTFTQEVLPQRKVNIDKYFGVKEKIWITKKLDKQYPPFPYAEAPFSPV